MRTPVAPICLNLRRFLPSCYAVIKMPKNIFIKPRQRFNLKYRLHTNLSKHLHSLHYTQIGCFKVHNSGLMYFLRNYTRQTVFLKLINHGWQKRVRKLKYKKRNINLAINNTLMQLIYITQKRSQFKRYSPFKLKKFFDIHAKFIEFR